MDKFLVYGNVSSRDYGVWISGSGIYNKPKKRVQKFTVPGRNGDLTIDEDAFENVKVTYPAFIAQGFEHRFNDFMAAMYAQSGYQRLEDNYDPDHFRQGLFCEATEPQTGVLNRVGSFDLVFDCKPQRWLKDGEKWMTGITFGTDSGGNQNAIIVNPTAYPAKPLFRVYGTGWMNLMERYSTPGRLVYYWEVTVDASYAQTGQAYLNIDSEIEECYKATSATEANSYVTMTGTGLSKGFPQLYPGESNLSKKQSGNITDIEILPRWWEI